MFLGNANSASIGTTIWGHLFCNMIFNGYFIVSYVDISLFSQFILRQIGCINIFCYCKQYYNEHYYAHLLAFVYSVFLEIELPGQRGDTFLGPLVCNAESYSRRPYSLYFS